jgi:hypothetical protein
MDASRAEGVGVGSCPPAGGSQFAGTGYDPASGTDARYVIVQRLHPQVILAIQRIRPLKV